MQEGNARWRGLHKKEKDDVMLMGVVVLDRLHLRSLASFIVFILLASS
jgi:hypothetical protein